MEKNQYNLCINVLKRLSGAGILDDLIIIGSWCIYFYQGYFNDKNYTSSIRTRDLDFLVPIPPNIKKSVNIGGLIKDLGFLEDLSGEEGYIKLIHPELIIEFLVPQKGKGTSKPYNLPQLGVNAQRLRYLDFLAKNTITIKFGGVSIKVPHPIAFAFHKLIISKRRQAKDKAEREKMQAVNLLKYIISRKEYKAKTKETFESLDKKWQKAIIAILEVDTENDILKALT